MAHYLLAVTPLAGHLAPMLAIGTGLRALGHDITVLTGAEFVDTVTSAGLDCVVLPGDVRIEPPAAMPARWRRVPPLVRRFWLGRTELESIYVAPLEAEAAALRAVLRDRSVDAVLVDLTFTGAVPVLLGDAARPPIVVCGVSPLTLTSVDTPPFGVAWRPEPGVDYSTMNAAAHRVVMRGNQRAFDRAVRRAGGGAAPTFISDWPRLAEGLLQLSVPGFEYPRRDLPGTVAFVGPVLPAAGRAADLPPWWDDVRTAAGVVLVTQGTFDNTDLTQLIEPALDALADRDDLLVVATTGGRRPGQKRPSRIPPNAHIVDWVSYPALMPHLDVMITNGGYGGVQYALGHGVPLVVAGETSDKAEIAARVEHSGVGVDLKTATPTPKAVRAAVRQIEADGRYRVAAQRLRDEIEKATPIDAIANTLKRCCDV